MSLCRENRSFHVRGGRAGMLYTRFAAAACIQVPTFGNKATALHADLLPVVAINCKGLIEKERESTCAMRQNVFHL